MYFYVRWYIVLDNTLSKHERNTFNPVFQLVKVLSFLVEAFLLLLLCALFKFFVTVKRRRYIIEYEDWDGFDSKQRLVVGWIMALISINFFFIFFKCFIRSISTITSQVNQSDEFDKIHKYRFVMFSVVDILNGVSILYAFYCMGLSSVKRKN